jgi:hypothetical protein
MKYQRKIFAACTIIGLVTVANARDANAIPAFARQTKMECAACHIGSFGPQLTQFGRDFKLNGYTMSASESNAMWKGIAAMVETGFEHTKKALPKGETLRGGDAQGLKTNNNVTVNEASLFYGGRLASNWGVFSQITYEQAANATAWDNVDLRYANTTSLGGKSLVYGLTFNNNPSVQDVWQTAPAWQFPYLSSNIAPAPDAAPYMTGLGQTVGGIGAYGMWDGLLYAELSGYGTLPDHVQGALGEQEVAASDHLHGIAPYWRLALQYDSGTNYFSVGTFGMDARRYPGNDRSMGSDKFLDTAVDATWQHTAGDHILSLYGSYIHEHQDLDATFALGGATNTSNSLNDFSANASYYYKNTYGITLSRFDITGSADALLYPDPSNHKPDSAGWTVQLDYTPFGHTDSFGWPYLNARLFLQYTAYDKFNGLKDNYDGSGRNASDNNTLFTGIWFAF